MIRILKGIPVHNSQQIYSVLICALLMTGCSAPLRIHSDIVPTGSLRLAQVTEIGKRADILQQKELYEAIIASGIKDSEVNDGSVVVTRITCCGGPSEKLDSRMIFVPKGVNVALGDIVEVSVGRPPEKGDAGLLNTVTRVVQKGGDNEVKCWWDPKNDRLWLRILYCDWMPKDGWVKQGGLDSAWYRPPISTTLPEK